jgi:hypothetical protein
MSKTNTESLHEFLKRASGSFDILNLRLGEKSQLVYFSSSPIQDAANPF